VIDPRAAQDPSDAAVRAALERVFARPEFRPERNALQEWIGRRSEEFVEWIKSFFGVSRESADRIAAWAFYLLIGIVAGMLIVWIVRTSARAVRRRRTGSVEASAPDPRSARVAELRRRARAAEAEGDHVLALRFYFWALVVGLGERGGLEYRDAWTNRELLERGAPAPEIARVLEPLVPELDRRAFGREPAVPGDVARMAQLCDEMLGAAQ
jgi:hypothetical protein